MVVIINMKNMKTILTNEHHGDHEHHGGHDHHHHGNFKELFYTTTLIAGILGIFPQDISYFLFKNLSMPLMVGLFVPTLLSLTLFILPPIFIYKSNKIREINRKGFNVYLAINAILGLLISSFSIIVFIAWLG